MEALSRRYDYEKIRFDEAVTDMFRGISYYPEIVEVLPVAIPKGIPPTGQIEPTKKKKKKSKEANEAKESIQVIQIKLSKRSNKSKNSKKSKKKGKMKHKWREIPAEKHTNIKKKPRERPTSFAPFGIEILDANIRLELSKKYGCLASDNEPFNARNEFSYKEWMPFDHEGVPDDNVPLDKAQLKDMVEQIKEDEQRNEEEREQPRYLEESDDELQAEIEELMEYVQNRINKAKLCLNEARNYQEEHHLRCTLSEPNLRYPDSEEQVVKVAKPKNLCVCSSCMNEFASMELFDEHICWYMDPDETARYFEDTEDEMEEKPRNKSNSLNCTPSKKTFKCPQCKKAFKSKKLMNRHRVTRCRK